MADFAAYKLGINRIPELNESARPYAPHKRNGTAAGTTHDRRNEMRAIKTADDLGRELQDLEAADKKQMEWLEEVRAQNKNLIQAVSGLSGAVKAGWKGTATGENEAVLASAGHLLKAIGMSVLKKDTRMLEEIR